MKNFRLREASWGLFTKHVNGDSSTVIRKLKFHLTCFMDSPCCKKDLEVVDGVGLKIRRSKIGNSSRFLTNLS